MTPHATRRPSPSARRADRELQRRAVVYGSDAGSRWWHRARGLVGLVLLAITSAVLVAGSVVGLVILAAYLMRSFSG